MKNVQIIDRAENATFSLFQVTEEEFTALFPGPGQDIEIVEDVIDRLGGEATGALLAPVWQRPILKRDAVGVHGTLYFGWEERREYLPATKREIDTDPVSINFAQRELFASKRQDDV